MKGAVIIVAGGTGSRMQSTLPKQFIELKGKPILLHTLEKFYSYDTSLQLIVVMHPDYVEYWKDLCRTLGFTVKHDVVAGGKERFFSVKSGLARLRDDIEVVAVHDAVRPLFSAQTLSNCFDALKNHRAVVPAIPLIDSIREVDEKGNRHVDRSRYKLVQTPQCFDRQLLEKSYLQEYKKTFTDDASVVESVDQSIFLVDGNQENVKITTSSDLLFCESIFS